MAEFVEIAKVSDVPDPGKRVCEVSDRLVVLIHAGGRFYCVDDVCTHDGGPLGEGQLRDHELVCPRHGARFDVRTGRALTMPATQPTIVHDVEVRGDRVWVRLADG